MDTRIWWLVVDDQQPRAQLSASADDGTIRLHRHVQSRARSLVDRSTTLIVRLACVGKHDDGVEEIAVSRDAKWLVSCGLDNKVPDDQAPHAIR